MTSDHRPALALERFDVPAAEPAPDPEPEPQPEPAPPPEPDPGPGAPPPPDPAETAARIAGALERAARDMARHREAVADGLARSLAEAAATAFPALARAGFPAELAEAARDLAAAGPPGSPVLAVAEAELSALAAVLIEGAPEGAAPLGLGLAADPRLAPGEARIDWRDGGAEIGAEAFARAGLEALARHLPARPPETMKGARPEAATGRRASRPSWSAGTRAPRASTAARSSRSRSRSWSRSGRRRP